MRISVKPLKGKDGGTDRHRSENPASAATLSGIDRLDGGSLNKENRYHRSAVGSTASELRHLADRVWRIHDPFRSDPERVLIDKDEIASRLVGIADRIEGTR